jgi:hypothetical protein
MKVLSCFLRVLLAALALSGTSCSTPDTATPTAANSGKYYTVSVKEAEFYIYGPQQGSGPDQKLQQDTLVLLIRPAFGYSKVQLMNGQQGYVASQDIRAASAEMVQAATNPPVSPESTGNTGSSGGERTRSPRFRYDIVDPRFLPPPEPLPVDIPEPAPEASPSPAP